MSERVGLRIGRWTIGDRTIGDRMVPGWMVGGWMVVLLIASVAAPGDAEVPQALLLQVNEARTACTGRLHVTLSTRGPRLDQTWKLVVRWETWPGNSASLATIRQPASLRGTSRLILERHDGSPDRAWVVLSPTTGDVLPVGDHVRGEGFLSADFSLDDDQRWIAPEHYELTRLPPAVDDDMGTVRLQGIPRGEGWVTLGYSRVVWWIDPSRRDIVRARFFDAEDVLIKELEVLEWVEPKMPGGCRVPRRQRMRNLRSGSTSILDLERFEPWKDSSREDFVQDFVPESLPQVAKEMIHPGRRKAR